MVMKAPAQIMHLDKEMIKAGSHKENKSVVVLPFPKAHCPSFHHGQFL